MSSTEQEDRSAGGRVGPTDQRPLTEAEFQQLQRMLGDPFSFPISYKTWLVSYLESSDLSLPISAINGLTQILGVTGVGGGTLGILPAGLIFPYGGSTPPTGSLLCDGASYSRTAQARLFTAIGESYGAVDAASFNVPDLQERIPVGRGTVAHTNMLGKNEGHTLGARGVLHQHSFSLGVDGHSHGLPQMTGGTLGAQDGNDAPARMFGGGTDTESFQTGWSGAGISGAIGSGPVDGPSFLVVNFIIVA